MRKKINWGLGVLSVLLICVFVLVMVNEYAENQQLEDAAKKAQEQADFVRYDVTSSKEITSTAMNRVNLVSYMRNILFLLIFMFLSVSNIISTSADIWHDNFDMENTEAWKNIGDRRVWKVVDGMLRVEVNRDWAVGYELYELIAFPGHHRDFVVTIKNFGGDKLRFGFCVGRRFPETADEDPFYYVFFPDEIRARRFNGRGTSHPFRYRLSREPRQRWDTGVIDEMELHFNSGFFLLFVDGEFRTKFKDSNFNRIEILGFVVEGINIANEWEAEGWVDAFTISGLNVSAEVKATETWAEIKGN